MLRHSLRLGLFFLLVGMLMTACQTQASAPQAEEKTLNVVASIPPLADFARWVGGDWVQVTVLVEPGQSPHTFEPLPSHVQALAQADVILFNGRGLEPWAADLLASANPQAKVVYITETEAFQNVPYTGNAHLWLDIAWAKTYISVIRNVFEEVQPAAQPKAQFYQSNLEAKQALDTLQGELMRMLDPVPISERRVAVVHAAWEPLLQPLDFTILPLLEGAAYEGHIQEIPPQTLAQWTTMIENENINVIVTEVQNVIPTLITLSQDTGVPLAELDPLGGMEGRETYADMMRYNVRTLVEALEESR